MSLRTLAVVNPASAGGQTLRRWPEIAAALRRRGITHDLHLTTAPNDAIEAVRAALSEGVERVIAVGGDGTLNEVVNGFFDASGDPLNPAAQLALIPSATGGDFRKAAGIPRDPDACAAGLDAERTRRIDAGRIQYADGARRWFINIADCGIGGEVVAAVNRSGTKASGLRGSATFLGLSLRALFTFQGRPARIVLDGDEVVEDLVQSVVVANGRYFGGGMHVAPASDLADGLFDVVVVGNKSRAATIAALPSLYRGTHVRDPRVRVHRARRVEVETPADPMLFDVDGEQIGATPAALECVPEAINLCVP